MLILPKEDFKDPDEPGFKSKEELDPVEVFGEFTLSPKGYFNPVVEVILLVGCVELNGDWIVFSVPTNGNLSP